MRAINLRWYTHAICLSQSARFVYCAIETSFVETTYHSQIVAHLWLVLRYRYSVKLLHTLQIFQFSIKIGIRCWLDLIDLIRAYFRANVQRKFPSIRNNWDWQLKELCQFVSSKCETPREKPSHSKFTNRISISRSRLPRIPSCDAVGIRRVELSSLIRDQMKRKHCMSSQFWLYLHFYAE